MRLREPILLLSQGRLPSSRAAIIAPVASLGIDLQTSRDELPSFVVLCPTALDHRRYPLHGRRCYRLLLLRHPAPKALVDQAPQ
jgi:hypothetical protein